MSQLFDRRYQLFDELGSGGMGTVYRARDVLTGDIVAVKRIHSGPDDSAWRADPESLHLALASEFQMLASLRHPNIITVHDYGLDEDRQPYFTMDLLDAPQTITQAQTVPFDTKVDWLIQALEALAYLHQNDILHRDLKPGNLLVVNDQHVKLVDFGLAAYQSQWKYGLGTLAYLAPELLDRTPPTVSSDIYALGLVAYELFFGHFPYETRSVSTLLYHIQHRAVTAPTGEVPAALGLVLERCLAKDPASRYADARSVLNAVCQATQHPLPPEHFRIRESYLHAARYTGRTAELTQLRAALQDALLGEGSAWLIAGESGIGKSRLLDEIRTYALLDGFHVIMSTVSDTNSNPFAGIGRGLRALIPVTTLTPLEAATLKIIIPDIDHIIGESIAPSSLPDPAKNEERLIHTILAVLQRQTSPLLILLDDLHHDVESLTLIRQIASLVLGHEIVLIGTYRSDDAPNLHHLLPEMQLLSLGPLTRHDIRRLIENMLSPTCVTETLVSTVTDYAEGNIFFITDLLETLAQQAGSLTTIKQMNLQPERLLSPGVIEIAQRRLNRMPSVYHQAVQLAAVIGREIDWPLMHHLAPAVAKDEKWLAYCASSAILRRRGQVWHFAHDKIRAGILDGLPKDTLTRLHQVVAETIEVVYPQDRTYALALTHYWRAVGDLDKERYYLDLAVQRLIDQGLPQHAQQLLESNLPRYPADDLRTGGLIYLLAQAVRMQGDPERRSLRLCQEALHIAEQAQAFTLQYSILSLLGSIAREQGNVALAESYYRRALAIAEQMSDPVITAKSLINMAAIKASAGDIEQAQALYKAGYAMAETANQPLGMTIATSNLGYMAKTQGDLEEAAHYYQQSLSLARENHYSHMEAQILIGFAEIQARQGCALEALQTLADAMNLARQMHSSRTEMLCHVQMGLLQMREPGPEADIALLEALRLSQVLHLAPISLLALVGFAYRELLRGDACTAAEIASCVRADSRMLAFNTYHLTALEKDVQAVLDDEVYTTASARGRAQTLDSWIARYLNDPPA